MQETKAFADRSRMGKKYLMFFLAVIFTVLLAPASLCAQTPGSEADVIKNAASHFEKEDYPAAMPLYSQLLANHPNDPNYNYRFGVCMLFANADKGKALPFLEVASKDPKAEVEVWFYLGRAYHLNYRFDEAITAYTKYKKLAGEKKAEKMQVDNQIAMCKTGKKLLRAVTDITVLEKKELPTGDFFRSYNLEGYSGQLLVKGDEFKTNLDRKKNETSIIFLSGEKNILYFSSYGDDESNGKDIYRVVRLPNGGWSKPFNVGYPINTEYDEDYPFLHPNGKVLYFSSKGHNSMGGYDIFRAELNEETGSWLKPANMDFAINSPDDDILFVTDFEEKTAWFASARNSPQGMMTVYHVVIERKPVNMCIISGKFKPNEGEGNASAKITVRNEETNQPVGVYKANEQTGAYLINLPNTGGKYTFTVEKSGINTQTKAVFVPPQYEMHPIRQEIFYLNEGEDKNLNIVTYFDDDTASFAPDFLKEKANLDVADPSQINGYSVTDVGTNNNTAANNQNTNNSNNTSDTGDPDDTDDTSDVVDPAANVPSSQNTVSTAELLASAYENAEETEKEAVAVQQQADRAFGYAKNLNEQAKAKQAEADKAKSDADGMTEGPDKVAAQEKAKQLQAEANALEAQTVAAYNVANGLSEDATQKKNESVLANEYAKSLDAASKSKDPKAMDAADQKEKELRAMSDVRPQGEENVKNLQEEADKKREQLQAAKSKSDDLHEEKKSNEDLIAKLQADAAKEKDPDLKAGYEAQIEGIRETMADNEAEIKKADNNVARLQNEVNQLDNQVAAANNTLNESRNTSVAPVAISPEEKKDLSTNVVAYQNEASSNTDYIVANNTTTYNNAALNSNNSNTSNTNNSNTNNSNTNNSNTNNSNTSNTNNSNTSTANNSNTSNTNNSNTSNTNNPNTNNPNTNNSNTSEPIPSSEDVIADIQGNVSEKIQEAENETDPAKQAELKQQAHESAVAALEEKIEATRTQLNQETDPTRKDQLSVNLQELQSAREEQQKLANESKAQAAALANNNTEPAQEDPLAVFSENLTAADTISDPAIKSSTKAQVYTDWSEALDEKIAADKQVLATTKDKAEKDSLKNLIAAEQKQSADLKQQAKTEKANEQKAIAAANSPAAKSERVYQEQIASLSQNPDVKEREAAKADIYRSWADSLNAEADKLDALAAKERNAKKKEELTNQAEQLRNEAGEKEALAQKSSDAAAQTDVVANNSNTSNSNNSNTSNTNNPNTNNSNTSNTNNSNTSATTNALTESGVSYTDPQAQSALKEKDQLLNAAKADRARQDSLIAASGNADGAEKNKLLADATAAQRAAWEKENEASASQGTANNEQFRNNEAELNAYREGAKGNSDPSVEIAALQMEEAALLMSKAEAKRSEAAKATSQYQKSEALKEAEQFENQALKKQQDALASYKKAGVEPSAVAVNSNTNNSNTSNTNNPNTNNPNTNNSNTNNTATTSTIVNPATGQPYTPQQVEEIRKSEEYTNYVALQEDANTFQEEVTSLDRQAEKYQQSANYNVEQAQEFALKASDESDPAKKREYLDQSNAFNNEAKKDMAKRDSVRELADNARIEAKAKQGEADLYLNALDKQEYEGVKAVAQNDLGSQENSSAVNNNVATNNNSTTNNSNTSNTNNSNTSNTNTASNNTNTNNLNTSNTNNLNTSNTNNLNTSNTNNLNTSNTNNLNTSNTNNPNTSNTNNSNTSIANTSRVASQLNAGEQFAITSAPNRTPIPVDQPVPSGIVYKVQIGAFRNPIPVDLFKGIQPLNAESAGNGITRYTAGLFTEFANADAAKNEIRAMGYPDAFVVAFRDGKRISVAEARGTSNQNNIAANTNNPNTNNSNTNNPNTNNPNTNNSNTNNSNTSNTNNSNTNNPNTNNSNTSVATNAAPSTDVTTVQGLFYTVQVGVYSRPVTAEKLYNLTGLFSERTANGYIRYAAGKYDNLNAAVNAKNGIVNTGIRDAFVTAYFNGQRISVERAQELERGGEKPVGSSQSNTNNTNTSNTNNPNTSDTNNPNTNNPNTSNTTNPNTSNTNNSNTSTPLPVVTNTKPNVPDTGTVFSVQLGAYRESVPIDQANRFFQFASRGISIYKDVNSGLTVYQVGALKSYADANSLKNEAVASGITDAFIVAWRNGAKISVEEALKQ
jgi:hypothetical protein